MEILGKVIAVLFVICGLAVIFLAAAIGTLIDITRGK